MDRLFELLLLDALASAAKEEEDRPDNFFVLPPNNNRVWQDVFKKCTEENMVVGIDFTTADQSQQMIRAATLRLARQFNRQAIFLRAPIGPLNTHDQLRRELGGVQYTPSFLIVSFLEDRGEIRRYEGSLEVRTAFETGKLRRDLEECLERRARLRGAENLAERMTAAIAAAVEESRKQEEAKAKETPEQRRAREAQEQEKRWKEEKEIKKEEEEKRMREEQRQIDEARRAAVEERRKRRPEFVSQLLAMDLNKAPIRDIKDIMKKLELNPAGLPERKDLIEELKRGVPELRMKLDNPSSTYGAHYQQPPAPPSPSENFASMDHDLLQGIAARITNIDLQRAETHELKCLLSQAKLRVKDYPDRNSIIQALNRVVMAAQKTGNRSSYFKAVYHSENLSSADNEQRAKKAVEDVKQLKDAQSKLDAKIVELQRQLVAKDQKIESLMTESLHMKYKKVTDLVDDKDETEIKDCIKVFRGLAPE